MSKKQTILSYIFVTVSGVLLHFVYEWSGKNFFVGLFSAVNESTWEHLKLVFFPMLLLTLWELWHSEDVTDFLPTRTIGIFTAMMFTVLAFYTYTGVIGRNIDFVNITIYFLAVAFGFWTEQKILAKTTLLTNKSAAILLLIAALLFLIFTYHPPTLGIFKAP